MRPRPNPPPLFPCLSLCPIYSTLYVRTLCLDEYSRNRHLSEETDPHRRYEMRAKRAVVIRVVVLVLVLVLEMVMVMVQCIGVTVHTRPTGKAGRCPVCWVCIWNE